jgi:hypothetical protein
MSVAQRESNRELPSKMRVKYLKSRQCPKCHAKVVTMLLRYSSTMSAINGICRKCDHSMKWLMLRGNASAATNFRRSSVAVGASELKNDQAAKSR